MLWFFFFFWEFLLSFTKLPKFSWERPVLRCCILCIMVWHYAFCQHGQSEVIKMESRSQQTHFLHGGTTLVSLAFKKFMNVHQVLPLVTWCICDFSKILFVNWQALESQFHSGQPCPNHTFPMTVTTQAAWLHLFWCLTISVQNEVLVSNLSHTFLNFYFSSYPL